MNRIWKSPKKKWDLWYLHAIMWLNELSNAHIGNIADYIHHLVCSIHTKLYGRGRNIFKLYWCFVKKKYIPMPYSPHRAAVLMALVRGLEAARKEFGARPEAQPLLEYMATVQQVQGWIYFYLVGKLSVFAGQTRNHPCPGCEVDRKT